VRGCQPPAVLRALADLVTRTGADRSRVAAALRRQADHVESGGTLETSVLARPQLRQRPHSAGRWIGEG
jgi:hypothetical protein